MSFHAVEWNHEACVDQSHCERCRHQVPRGNLLGLSDLHPSPDEALCEQVRLQEHDPGHGLAHEERSEASEKFREERRAVRDEELSVGEAGVGARHEVDLHALDGARDASLGQGNAAASQELLDRLPLAKSRREVVVVKPRHPHHEWVAVDVLEYDSSHVRDRPRVETPNALVLVNVLDNLQGQRSALPATRS